MNDAGNPSATRVVLSFLEPTTCPVEPYIPGKTKLYHGTTNKISMPGGEILPPSSTNTISEVGQKKNLDKVFLTPDLQYAWIYAGRASRVLGGQPVVYEVSVDSPESFTDSSGCTIYTAPSARIVRSVTEKKPAAPNLKSFKKLLRN